MIFVILRKSKPCISLQFSFQADMSTEVRLRQFHHIWRRVRKRDIIRLRQSKDSQISIRRICCATVLLPLFRESSYKILCVTFLLAVVSKMVEDNKSASSLKILGWESFISVSV